MNYNILITLSEEQNDALLATVSEINSKGGTTTAESLLQESGTNFIKERVKHYYDAALQRFGTGFAAEEYAKRKAIMADLESKLPKP